MKAWPGKYVIGLTGNIATGKSVVRKMLEHLGAFGIDADSLGHRAIAKGAPGYSIVVDTFGHWILGTDGQIDRPRLGRLVFADAEALSQLEAIVHPLVRQALDVLIRRVPKKVVVIEAVKLLESNLGKACDSVWVVHAPEEVQIARLMKKRKMSAADARMRIEAQPPQEAKLAVADVIIQNDSTFDDSWRQVIASWKETFPAAQTVPLKELEVAPGALQVQRARPGQAKQIAGLITRLSNGQKKMSREDVMAAFGEKAFLVLQVDQKMVGLVGWQVENLVARTTDVEIEPGLPLDKALTALIHEMERASRDLQCEASLLFLAPALADHQAVWEGLGYEEKQVEELDVRAWQEAARESMPQGTVLMFKRLRKDRVLRPV